MKLRRGETNRIHGERRDDKHLQLQPNAWRPLSENAGPSHSIRDAQRRKKRKPKQECRTAGTVANDSKCTRGSKDMDLVALALMITQFMLAGSHRFRTVFFCPGDHVEDRVMVTSRCHVLFSSARQLTGSFHLRIERSAERRSRMAT